MICDRCGRNNPDNLAFCQDCGRRLASQQAAIVPPTPPTGLGVVPLPADAAADGTAGRMSRPAAPAFSFEPQREAEGPICAACGTRNPVGNRFCVSCGTRLASAASQPPAAAVHAGTMQASHVVQVAPSVSAQPAARIVCPRCNGASEATMLYCQFCGASLRPDHRANQGIPSPRVVHRAEVVMPGDGASHAAVEHVGYRAPAGQEASGRLVTIARDGAEGTVYPMIGDSVDMGREEGHVLLPEDAYVSPRHLRLVRREHGWYAKDLGSVNGIYLRLRKSHALVDGDLLLVGLQVLRFEAVREAEQGFGPATQHGTLLFGSPMLPRYGRLCERTVEGVTRNVFYLHRDETIIGRESGDIVFTDDPFMSRRHVAIRLDGATATFTVSDLGSSNGTYLAVRGEVPLGHGDFLRIGQHLFRVDLDASRPPPQGGPPAGGVRRMP